MVTSQQVGEMPSRAYNRNPYVFQTTEDHKLTVLAESCSTRLLLGQHGIKPVEMRANIQ
jgi:hypothetical protein